ncbi:hypothetical protein KY309_02600 [Candidatus Woesearchaeota archaeon]|nr:hypothetical protein [Candidatus Woesearchaeota archaeon]MBW3016476.1 hypothetical protein [Candidatus Woesearchaeota archaeon]
MVRSLWPPWKILTREKVEGISPKTGSAMSKSIRTAKNILLYDGKRVFEKQREQIADAEKIAKTINNQLFSMKQFSSQIAEWTDAVKSTLDHVAEQKILVDEMQTKFSEYKDAVEDLRKIKQGLVKTEAPAPYVEREKRDRMAQALEAISRINAELKKLQDEVTLLHEKAKNLLSSKTGPFRMLDSLCDGLVKTSDKMGDSAGAIYDLNKRMVSAFDMLISQFGDESAELFEQINKAELEYIKLKP